MARTLRSVTLTVVCFVAGIAFGGWLFAKTEPRSIIGLGRCENCMTPADVAGLLASIGIQRAPGLMPFVVAETERTIAFKKPNPNGHLHFVIVPKRDIKDIAHVERTDDAYLMDAMLVVRSLVEQYHLWNYRLYTNGPGLQSVTYLHFHLEENPIGV